MKNSFKRMIWIMIAVLATSSLAMAQPEIQLRALQIPEPPDVARHAAAYGTLTNTGSSADTLIAVKSQIAQSTELHETVIEDGIAYMRSLSSLLLKPGSALTLKPMSYHIMLKGLTQPLKVGDAAVRLTFVFERLGAVAAEAQVMK